jgi:hypothetical protein
VGAAGTVYWRGLSSSTKLPAIVPTGQNPSCPVRGFAAGKMTSIKQNATVTETFGPELEHLLVDAGYTGGVRDSVHAALDVIGTRPEELTPDARVREIAVRLEETTTEAASPDMSALRSPPTS